MVPKGETQKPYHEMNAAERLAARIAKNREIEARIKADAPAAGEKPKRKAAAAKASVGRGPNNTLDKFHEIRRMHGIDAASEYLRQLRDEETSK
jgi:hypothetical protein